MQCLLGCQLYTDYTRTYIPNLNFLSLLNEVTCSTIIPSFIYLFIGTSRSLIVGPTAILALICYSFVRHDSVEVCIFRLLLTFKFFLLCYVIERSFGRLSTIFYNRNCVACCFTRQTWISRQPNIQAHCDGIHSCSRCINIYEPSEIVAWNRYGISKYDNRLLLCVYSSCFNNKYLVPIC